MTREELAKHQFRTYGRDYRESDDGYGDMEAEERRGWHAIPSWGRDGWDLGEWPYVILYMRVRADKHELLSICEGDRTWYQFDSRDDCYAAMDYLFLWYLAGRNYAPLSYEDRERLDKGELEVDAKWRGPYNA